MHELFITKLSSLPPFTGIGIFYYLAQAGLVLIVFHAIRLVAILLINKHIAIRSSPYVSPIESSSKILILGDSTAVGTGASMPSETIAGMLAHDFPHTQVINVGVNGSTVEDLTHQISHVSSQQFKLIIISSGGNDTWKLSRSKTIEAHLRNTLSEAIRISNHRVIFLINNQVGFGPFPKFIAYFLTKRARKINSLIEKISYELEVPVIDIFTQSKDNPFFSNPKKLLSSDGIHPSSAGYALWYHRMWRIMVQQGFHYYDE